MAETNIAPLCRDFVRLVEQHMRDTGKTMYEAINDISHTVASHAGYHVRDPLHDAKDAVSDLMARHANLDWTMAVQSVAMSQGWDEKILMDRLRGHFS